MNVLEDLNLPKLPEPLPRPVIDSHTHLDTTEEISGLPVAENLRLAKEVGVTKVVHVATDLPGSYWAVDFVKHHTNAIVSLAIHPNDAARLEQDELEAQLARLDALVASDPRIRGVGETGLDYFRTVSPEGIARQKFSFARHIEIATKHDLTLVIHDRESHNDILKVLDETGVPKRVVMHCFSGDADFAEECLARNAWLSFPGTITYPASTNLREALAVTPLDRILVETDAPFLTAVPNRGRRNAPYLIPYLMRYLADLLEVKLETLCDQITANTEAAFNGAWGDE